MATDSNTLLDEAKCLGCASNSSISDLLKLGILGRIASAYSAVQSFISRSGITDPAQIAAIESLAESAVQHGWWGKCDLIYPFVGGNATAHAQNLKSSSFTITWNGTVTHDANGITGNGVDGYGDTGYIPATSGQITQNNVHISLYRRTFGTSGTYLNSNSFAGNGLLALVFNATFNRFALNDLNLANTTTQTKSLGFVVVAKIDSSFRRSYNGGTEATAAPNPGPSSTNTVPILCTQGPGAGAFSSFSNSNLAGVTIGSGITFAEYILMASDWQTFQTALGRQV